MVSSGSNPSNKDRPVVLYLMRFQSVKKGSFERFLIALQEKAGSQFDFVFVFEDVPPIWLRDALSVAGARVDSAYLRTSWRSFSDLDRLVKKYRPDIIHLHFFSLLTPFIPYLRWRHGVKIVNHVHGFEVERKGISGWLVPLRKYLAAKSVHRVLGVSEYVRKKTASQFPFNNQQLIAVVNGVELPDSNMRATDIRSSLGISDDALIIFSVAWLHEVKGLHILIQSLPGVYEEVQKKVVTIVAGDGPELPRLRALAESLRIKGKVIFLGWRDDVPQLLDQADIVVIPSMWEEPCAYTVLEALAAGKSVVASDTGGITELISGNPPAGILVPPADIKALSTAIKDLIIDPEKRDNLSAEAKKRIYTKLHISRQIEEISNVYAELIS